MKRANPRRLLASAAFLGALVTPLLLTGCDQFGDDTTPGSGNGDGNGNGNGGSGLGEALGSPGDQLEKSDGTSMFVDPNSLGQAGSLRVLEVFWGRLVDLYAFDDATDTTERVHERYVIGEEVESDGADYLLEEDPITGTTKLTILHPRGSEAYDEAFLAVHDSLVPIQPFAIGGLGPFTLVPRNATVVVRFNDLIDPETISSDSVRTVIGNPPTSPYDARVLPDPNYGQLFGQSERTFYPTRILIDPTISESEIVLEFPPPPVNNVGLPESPNQQQANVALRFPSQPDFGAGVFDVLQNLNDRGLDPLLAATADLSTPSRPVVFAFRSGSSEDPNNGFLRDDIAPRIVGQLEIVSSNIRCATGGGSCEVDPADRYRLDVQFSELLCAQRPRVGDMLELANNNLVEVLEDGDAPDGGGFVRDLLVLDLAAHVPSSRLIRDAEGQAGNFLATFSPQDGDLPGCFVTFSPPASRDLVGDEVVASGVVPGASINVRFNEAMDPASTSALEDLLITRIPDEDLDAHQIVVATAVPSPNLRQVAVDPLLPLSHVQGNAEAYFFRLGERPIGLTDLAGNRVANVPDEILEFSLEPSAPTDENGGYVLRFNNETLNEADVPVDDDGPEITGQFLHDPVRGSVRGRAVARYSMIVDGDNPVVSAMAGIPIDPTQAQVTVYDLGTNEPLVGSFGSRTMTLWRYCDMGFSVGGLPPDGSIWDIRNNVYFNLDVEGLNWAARGSVIADVFDEYEIALAHSRWFPDEGFINSAAGPVIWPNSNNSGLHATESFRDNALSDGTDNPLKVVHSRERGYTIDPIDSFTSASDTLMMPFPLNEGSNPSQYRYYTWRDTAIQALGGLPAIGIDLVTAPSPIVPYAQGIPPQVLFDQLGLIGYADFRVETGADLDEPVPHVYIPAPQPSQAAADFAWQGAIPSVAMPLLMDFRCFPDTGGGFNRPAVRYAGFPLTFGVTAPTNFRITSTGGVDTGGNTVKVDPDLALNPTGGFNANPGTAAAGGDPVGAPTPAGDSMFHLGQVDLVARVSRTHTRWFDVQGGGLNIAYKAPILFPANDDQPLGTRVDLAFRGAVNINPLPNAPPPNQSALALNAYGDEREFEAQNDPTWFVDYGDPAQRNTSITFLNNDTGWVTDMQDIDTARHFQARLSFVSNPESGLAPSITAVGFVYDIVDN